MYELMLITLLVACVIWFFVYAIELNRELESMKKKHYDLQQFAAELERQRDGFRSRYFETIEKGG